MNGRIGMGPLLLFMLLVLQGVTPSFNRTLTDSEKMILEAVRSSDSFDTVDNSLKKVDFPNVPNDTEVIYKASTAIRTDAAEIQVPGIHEYIWNEEVLLKKKTSVSKELSGRLDALFLPWDNKNIPGVAVAVISGGSIIYKKGFGMANLEYQIPITPETVFHIASVSKQFTVFSLLLLQKEGKLTLEDEVHTYLPEIPDFGQKITLRHLASHTSGLRDQWNLLALAGWRLDDVITREQILKIISMQEELNFMPGEEFLYCNTGFTLLAEVIARVSGVSFADFTQKRIFEPLGMKHSSFYDDHEKLIRNRAYSYYMDSTGYRKSVLNYATVGATSLMTTIDDLSLWALNFRTPRVGNKELIEEMNTPSKLNTGKRIAAALGQFTGQYNGLKEIQHGGADAGYRSYLARYPDQDVSIALMSNDAGFDAAGMVHRVADILFESQFTAPGNKALAPVPTPITDSLPDREVLESYVGTYELQPDFFINITMGNGTLSARASGQLPMRLQPISATEFSVTGSETVISFLPRPNGVSLLMQFAQGGEVTDARRVNEFEMTPGQLAGYLGRYYSDELGTEYEFLEIAGNLVARHHRHSDIELKAIKKDVYRSDTWFFRELTFERNEVQSITGCRISSGRVRNLRFQKLPNRNPP